MSQGFFVRRENRTDLNVRFITTEVDSTPFLSCHNLRSDPNDIYLLRVAFGGTCHRSLNLLINL